MSSFKKVSRPFLYPSTIEIEGHHGDESDFRPMFDEVCGSGRINQFESPPAYRLRLQRGLYWDDIGNYRIMGASIDLMARYQELFSQGKVIAEGAGHEPSRWNYLWPQDAIHRVSQKEKDGLSMEPFLNLLLKPISERPSNIRECINFFYPVSGSIPPDRDISPFLSTTIASYYVPNADPSQGGNIPLQLGEVSMMYGWYLAWRMILCPNQFEDNILEFLSVAKLNPEFPFSKVPEELVLDPRYIKDARRDAQNDIETLADISTAIGLVTSLAQAANSTGVGLPEDFKDLQTISAEVLGIDSDSFVGEIIHKYGTAWVASTIAKYVEIPYTHLNDLASVAINGLMSLDKWESLVEDANKIGGSPEELAFQRAAKATRQIGQGFVSQRIKDIAPELSQDERTGLVSLVEQFMLTGVPSRALRDQINRIEKKKESAKTSVEKALLEVYDTKARELALRTSKVLRDFTQFGNSRPNPEPITTLVIIGVSVAGKLIQGGLEYQARQKKAAAEGIREYLSSNLYRLDPVLLSGEVSFDLTKHIRAGYWDSSKGGWANTKLEPDCKLQQGGQVLDYWTHAWSRVREVVSELNNDRKDLAKRSSLSETPLFGRHHYTKYFRNLDGVGYPAYGFSQEGALPRKDTYHREEYYIKRGFSRCQGLGVLAKHVDASMRLTLENIHLLSPFTHAFGFCPTAQLLPNGYMKINGVAPRRFLGRDNLNYTSRKDGQARASEAPGRIWPSTRIHLKNAYGPHGVECWARKAPLPSRRLLEGAFGQRCNLSFDVGLHPEIPVMDSQFCGLMAVLLSHPEALKTCYEMGFLKDLYERSALNKAAQISRRLKLPVLQTAQLLINYTSPKQTRLTPEMARILISPGVTAAVDKLNISPSAVRAVNRLISRNDQHQVEAIPANSESSKKFKVVASAAIATALGVLAYKIHRAGR